MAVKFTTDHTRTSEYRFNVEDITIRPDLNGRTELPDIEWLITDILFRGQHTPVVIRNDGGLAVLVSGFSRWRAISEINRRGLSPVVIPVRCTYVQCSESEAFLINISENRFRNPTTPIDDAHNIKRLINIYAKTEDQIAEIYFPTAKTENELKEARKFVQERVALIALVPEAETAVRAGRVTPTAAKAIAKLSEAQQREVLKKEGTIERIDVVFPKEPKIAPKLKPVPKDAELLRRIALMFEDVAGILYTKEMAEEGYVQVDRILLVNLFEYVYPEGQTAR